jgi:DNA invertase Pin-like site-specific DNA recombinase
MKVAIYARVSTPKNGNGEQQQNPETQLLPLRDYCRQRGWECVGEYVDRVSGAKESRPALNRLVTDAHRRKFGAVVVWKFDRFARSVSHLLRALEEFKALGIEFVSLTEAVDTSTPMGKMVFTVLGAVAELERNLIAERVKAGMHRARTLGHIPGRKVPKFDMDTVRQRIALGESQRAIAKSLGVSAALINKRLKGER